MKEVVLNNIGPSFSPHTARRKPHALSYMKNANFIK